MPKPFHDILREIREKRWATKVKAGPLQVYAPEEHEKLPQWRRKELVPLSQMEMKRIVSEDYKCFEAGGIIPGTGILEEICDLLKPTPQELKELLPAHAEVQPKPVDWETLHVPKPRKLESKKLYDTGRKMVSTEAKAFGRYLRYLHENGVIQSELGELLGLKLTGDGGGSFHADFGRYKTGKLSFKSFERLVTEGLGFASAQEFVTQATMLPLEQEPKASRNRL